MELAAISPPAVSSHPGNSLETAIHAFQNILTEAQRSKLANIGSIRDAETVMIFTAQLDRENQLRKGRGVASRLHTFLQSVQAFSTVVETFVSSHPEIAALVWGSIKLTLLIAINFTSYCEALSSLFMACGKQCPRFDQYQAIYPASSRLQKALCDFHASIVRCCTHAVEATQRPWAQQLKKALFQSFEQEFRPDMQDIQKLGEEVKEEINLAKALVDLQDQKLQDKERTEASKSRAVLRSFIAQANAELSSIKELQRQQSARRSRVEKQRLLEFLSSHDHLAPFREACKKRQCNTAEWMCEIPEFIRRYEGHGPPLLWCSGKIGSGKTVLCANVINHILAKKGCEARLSFFFLDRDNPDSLTAETVIRSIIRQSIDPMAVPERVVSQLRKLDRALFVKTEDWVSLLQYMITQSAVFFILIDGLDECAAAERQILLGLLSSLATTTSSLKIFIASRDSVKLDLRGRFLSMERVPMARDSLTSDIRVYVDVSIQNRSRNQELRCRDPSLLTEVRDKLTEHADGMFLWVTFLLDDICAGSCDDDIRQSLRNLPRDLEETYIRVLSRILSRVKLLGLVQKIFRWVTVAKRPMTLDELREAVSIDVRQQYLKPERLVHDMTHIILWCENLLQITEEEPSLVQFAHSSIRDFLLTADLPRRLVGFHIDPKEADHFAGEICVTYLHLNEFKTTVARRQEPLRINPVALASTALGREQKIAGAANMLTNITLRHRNNKIDPDLREAIAMYSKTGHGELEKSLQEHSFLAYATKHWISHTSNFRRGRSITWDLWCSIITDGSIIANIPWQRSTFQNIDNSIIAWSYHARHHALLRYATTAFRISDLKKTNMMKTSAFEGDDEGIQIFLNAGDCSVKCTSKALGEASRGGHLEVIERLLKAGANVNAPAGAEAEGRTALQAASEGGHLEVVERLLKAGANINATAAEFLGRTALQAAAGGGHLEVVERLLKAGANINATAAEFLGRTALQAASGGGHLEVVERLLDAGADINAAVAKFIGRTALQAASEGGHLEVVERLLSAGAIVNAAAARYAERTALQAASEGGHLEVVERLLKVGANFNATAAEFDGRTALQAASGGGHLEVVERLLNAGADVNTTATGSEGRTALQAASEGGHFEVVERLLSAGAKVNAPAAKFKERATLGAASECSYSEVVERFLSVGAIVERPLSAGANVNAPATKRGGRTALQAASGGGHLEVVERLLNAGADINAAATGSKGRTSLQAASEGGHLKVVERLLKAGANVNATAAEFLGRTALQAASGGGHLEVVERLLNAKANVNTSAVKRGGRTALEAASEGGHLEVVKRLLSAGANVNTHGVILDGRQAIQAASGGGHLEVVERLLSAGADINATAARTGGRTALQAASEGGHLEVVKRLLSAGANVNAPDAVYGGHTERTTIRAASKGGQFELVERLISAGVNFNGAAISWNWGRTALQAASEGGHLEVVERLLSAGADLNAVNDPASEFAGRTALQAASGSGHLEVVERLLNAGANVNAHAARTAGRTALQAASHGNHVDIIERLKSVKAK